MAIDLIQFLLRTNQVKHDRGIAGYIWLGLQEASITVQDLVIWGELLD